MTSDLMMGLFFAGGSFLGFALFLGIIIFVIVRALPGHAAVSRSSGAVDGVIRAVRVTLERDKLRGIGVRMDPRLNQVCIDVDGPNGGQRFVDRPVRPNNLPMRIRRQVYSIKLRRRDLNFNIEDEARRRHAAYAAEHGGYEFQLATPVPVSFVPPESEGKRIRWQMN